MTNNLSVGATTITPIDDERARVTLELGKLSPDGGSEDSEITDDDEGIKLSVIVTTDSMPIHNWYLHGIKRTAIDRARRLLTLEENRLRDL